jgi:replicative superfamily II helicase
MTKKDDNTINLSDKKVKFWTDQINEETAEKKRDLERELEKKVDENIDSKVSSFMKELKLDKLYKDHETNDKNLQDFLNQKDLKEQSLRDKKKESADSFIDLFNRQARIHDWSTMYEHDRDIEDFDRHIKNVCRTEYFNELKKNTPEGKLLQEIDGKRKAMLRALNQPRLKFKEVDFNAAMSNGFNAIGIEYKPIDIHRANESEETMN